jgi:hypothetical protein
MKTIGQIFNELMHDGFFKKRNYLGTDAMLSNNDIKHYQLSPINRDIYIKNISNCNNIILGEKFNIVFNIKEPKNYQKIDCEINYVSLKKNDNIEFIPRGYGGIVRLKFKDQVPEITKVLMQDSYEKYDNEKNSHLYFTTQEVMDKILEELDKQENPIS